MKPLNLRVLEHELNSDPETQLQARDLTTRIRVIIADVQSFTLHVVDGQFTIDPVVTPFDTFDINLEGSAEQWEGLLAIEPPPFYQDFFPALLHHGFRLEGDMPTIIAYYPVIRRLREVFADVAKEVVA